MVEIAENLGDLMIGVGVDQVSEVLNINKEDIEDTPTFGMNLETEYILGIAKI